MTSVFTPNPILHDKVILPPKGQWQTSFWWHIGIQDVEIWVDEDKISKCRYPTMVIFLDAVVTNEKLWKHMGTSSTTTKWQWLRLTREKYRGTEMHGWFLVCYGKSLGWSFFTSEKKLNSLKIESCFSIPERFEFTWQTRAFKRETVTIEKYCSLRGEMTGTSNL